MNEKVDLFFENHKKTMGDLQKEVPDLVKTFGALFYSTMKDGALSSKTKELIALGIAVAQRCEPCIRLHVKKAIEAGCSKEEMLEASGVSVVMQGGPAHSYLAVVLETIQALMSK